MRQLTPEEIRDIKLAIAWLKLPEIKLEREKKLEAKRREPLGSYLFCGTTEERHNRMLKRRAILSEIYEPGMSIKQISKDLGVNKTTVSIDLDVLGLRKRVKK